MNRIAIMSRKPVTLAIALAVSATSVATPAFGQSVRVNRGSDAPGASRTARGGAADLNLSIGRGQLINLSAPISDVFVSNEGVADVQVRSSTQIYVLAKTAGESTVYATSKSGAVVYSANIRVGANVSSIDQMLKLAMPDAEIIATPMNGMVLLTGTVRGPNDSAEAEKLVQAYVGDNTRVVSRLRSATPLQVNLQVKIAEVNRSLVKEIGVNLANRDIGGGLGTVISQGRPFVDIKNADLSALPKLDASSVFGLPAGSLSLPFDPRTGQFVTGGTSFDFKNLALGAGKTSIGIAGKLFGLDFASALDLAENEGLVTTLAQPNLTALSGETASFLAGGEFPVPISQDLGSITIQYKQYGVSLAFSPTVLDDGRISMRVRPEVSELSSQGTIRLNGFDVPALTTRRAETTVELGSGQSFMIGGLLQNSNVNAIDRAPGLGNVPILGAMFRSTRYRRAETELVIIVTPYLVKPVSANQIALPTDGYKAATDLERVFLGKSFSGKNGGERPKPTSAPPTTVIAPSLGSAQPMPAPVQAQSEPVKRKRDRNGGGAAPGFSGN